MGQKAIQYQSYKITTLCHFQDLNLLKIQNPFKEQLLEFK